MGEKTNPPRLPDMQPSPIGDGTCNEEIQHNEDETGLNIYVLEHGF